MTYVKGRAHCVTTVSYMDVRTDNPEEVKRWLAGQGARLSSMTAIVLRAG